MNTSPALYEKQHRLAQYYLGKLRSAHRTYQRGGEHIAYGLRLMRQDWGQIQQWQAWSVTQAQQQREAVTLCSAYPYEAGALLDLMLTPQEHRVWREPALAAARQQGNQQAELAHLLALAEIRDKLDHHSAAGDCAQQALDLAEQLGDQNGIAQACLVLGNLACIQGKNDEAQRYLEQSLNRFRLLSNRRELAKTFHVMGVLAFAVREMSRCVEYLEQALSLYQELGDYGGASHVLHALRARAPEQDIHLPTPQDGEKRVHIFLQMGDRLGAADLLMLLANERILAVDPMAAQEYTRRSLEIHRQLGVPRRAAFNLLRLGIIASLQEENEQARDYYLEALTMYRQLEMRPRIAHVLALLAFAYWGLGDGDKVRASLREGLPMAQEVDTSLALSLNIAAAAALRLLTNDPKGCAMIVGMVDAYPTTPWDVKLLALGALRQRLEKVLTPEGLSAALERGRALDFNATVSEIMVELNS